MARGTYQIAGTPNTIQPNDTSWKSCMCTMIIILVVLFIAFLVIPWGPRKDHNRKSDHLSSDRLKGDAEIVDEDKISERESFEKIESVYTSTTDDGIEITKIFKEWEDDLESKRTLEPYTITDVDELIKTIATTPMIAEIDPPISNAVTYSTENSVEIVDTTAIKYDATYTSHAEEKTNTEDSFTTVISLATESSTEKNDYDMTTSLSDTTILSDTATTLDTTTSLSDTRTSLSDTAISLSDTEYAKTSVSETILDTTTSLSDTATSLSDIEYAKTTASETILDTTTSLSDTATSLSDIEYAKTTALETILDTTTSLSDIEYAKTTASETILDTTTSLSDTATSLSDIEYAKTTASETILDTTTSLSDTATSLSDIEYAKTTASETILDTTTSLSDTATSPSDTEYAKTYSDYDMTTPSLTTENVETYTYPVVTIDTMSSTVKDMLKDGPMDGPSSDASSYSEADVDKSDKYSANKSCTQFCTKCPEANEENNKTCNTPTCKRTSSNMLSLMSYTTKPCDDFYQYACEGISEDYISETDLNNDILQRIRRKHDDINSDSPHHLKIFKKHYLSCLNYDADESGVYEMKKALKTFGKIYDLFTDNSTLPELTHLLTSLLQKNFAALFDLRIGLNDGDTTFGIIISPVIHKSVHREVFHNENEKCNNLHDGLNKKDIVDLKEIYEIYVKCLSNTSSSETYLETLSTALDHMNPHSSVFSATLLEELLEALKYKYLPTLELNKPSALEIKRMSTLKSENKIVITIGELQNKIRGIDWFYIFNKLGFEGCVNSTKVTVYHFDYLERILNQMGRKHCREMHNTLLAIYLHHIYQDLILDQNRIVDRGDYCFKFSVNLMKDISSALYINSFDETDISLENNRYKISYNELISTLRAEIKTGDWIKVGKKMDAFDIVGNLVLYTIDNYVPDINSILEKRYKDIDLTDEFILNTQKLESVFRDVMYSKYQSDPKLPENMWSIIVSPIGLKPITLHKINALVLPFPPVHSQKKYNELPGYLSMSDLMFDLAREVNSYLEESKFKLFESESKADPYNMTIEATEDTPKIKITLDPEVSLIERVLDSAAAKLSYTHYRRNYMVDSETEKPLPWLSGNGDQLYFTHLAQRYCTKKSILKSYVSIFEGTELHPVMKVNSIAVNSAQFKDAYKCDSNNTMVGGMKYLLGSTDEYTSDYY